MDFKRAYITTLVFIFFIATGFAGGYFVKSLSGDESTSLPLLDQALNILVDNGLKEIPVNPDLEYGMIRGMVQAYNDPYTLFIEPVQHELESDTLAGKFGGIGVRLGNDADGNIVLYPLPDGPADKAGIEDNDRLVKIEDMLITDQTPIDQIQAAVRGPVGSWVMVTIARPPDFVPIKYKIKRAEIPLPSVTWHIDPDESRLGVIEVNIIAASTPDEIIKAVKDLQDRNATSFVLDLRDNSGGLLTAGVDTARLFLKEGEVIQQQYKGKEIENYQVESPGQFADIPLVVLVNQNTASAAEIIAGSIKAHQRAKLIGTKTYGKDTIQLVFDLEDGSSLHVTSAHWWVPGLNPPIAGNGVEPDIIVDPADQNNSISAMRKAAEILLGTGTP
jgi:carboxyl-terminal processing protease